MVVGTIIGASIFVQPSEITGQVPTVVGIYAVWLICGVLTLFGALVCAELASTFPEAGGVYAYLREAFSPAVGFLWGWAMFWIALRNSCGDCSGMCEVSQLLRGTWRLRPAGSGCRYNLAT